jgi:hypothetical protein
MKHVERLTEINKLWNVVSCWLYSAKKEGGGTQNEIVGFRYYLEETGQTGLMAKP